MGDDDVTVTFKAARTEGLWFITCATWPGLLVVGRDLATALINLPAAIKDLQDAGATPTFDLGEQDGTEA